MKTLEGHKVPREPKSRTMFDNGEGSLIEENDLQERYPISRYLKEPRNSRLQRNENIEDSEIEEKRNWREIGQRTIPTAFFSGSGSTF
jgi:hypothetical protein